MKMKRIIAGLMAFAMLFGMAYADNGIISKVVNTVSVSAETLDNGLTMAQELQLQAVIKV